MENLGRSTNRNLLLIRRQEKSESPLVFLDFEEAVRGCLTHRRQCAGWPLAPQPDRGPRRSAVWEP